MSVTTGNQDSKKDVYAMSDEEILNLDPSQFESADSESSIKEEEGGDAPTASIELNEEQNSDELSDEEEAQASDEVTDNEEEADEEDDDLPEDEEDGSETDDESLSDSEDDESEEDKETENESSENEIDYEAEYKKLLAPFKANGKQIQVKSADEAISLMQMGANYHKKMAAMKPALKTLKMLEKNKLLDDSKISLLIDASNGDKAAINKLIKDNNIDSMELEESGDYSPKNRTVSDSEVDLDLIFQENEGNPHFEEVTQNITKEWDEESKKYISQYPEVLNLLTKQKESGVYDIVNAELYRQKALGKFAGMSYLNAYRAVGDDLNAQGAFDNLGSSQNSQATPTKRKVIRNKPKAENTERAKRRKAASPSKGSKTPKQDLSDFNPLGLSDEEFEKQFSELL